MSVPFPSLLRDLCLVLAAEPLTDAPKVRTVQRPSVTSCRGALKCQLQAIQSGAPARRLCLEVEGRGRLGRDRACMEVPGMVTGPSGTRVPSAHPSPTDV